MTEASQPTLAIREAHSWVQQILLCVLLVFARSGEVNAQTDSKRDDIDSVGLRIDVAPGWDGIVDQMTPAPLAFLIHNDSERNIEGQLFLTELRNGSEINLGNVFVSPRASYRLTSIQSLNDWFDAVVTLRHQGKILWRRRIDLVTGKSFDGLYNNILLVDLGERRLDVTVDENLLANSAGQQIPVAGRMGRPVRSLTVKPWQISNHPGPLFVAQAMVFPEGTAERDLNLAQWKAVAEWMCQGGTVFVHSASIEIIKRLTESAPLGIEDGFSTGPFQVRRSGLGAIYLYADPLFSANGKDLRQTITQTVATNCKSPGSTFSDAGYIQQTHGGQADKNRLLVISLFGIYTLLSGVVTLFLFRLSQQRIAAYITFVVVVASISAGTLGGFLRNSQGDVQWVTLTQAGVGGLVQVASIEVQSAGGRNRNLAVKGEMPDLQLVGRERFYHYNYLPRCGFSPFTWQANLAPSGANTYQINVAMSPWGRRRCHATAFRRDPQRLEFELDYTLHQTMGNDEGKQRPTPSSSAGTLKLNVENRLPFDLIDCWLVVGVTQIAKQQVGPNQMNLGNRMQYMGYTQTVPVDGMIDLYHSQRLPDLPHGKTHEADFDANFQQSPNQSQMDRHWPRGSRIPPRISHMGTASAWIIARISRSPIMQIDEELSDFVLEEDDHLFIQEILPEDISKNLFFVNTASSAGAQSQGPIQNSTAPEQSEPSQANEVHEQ